jgi:hypothetical protein
MALPSATFGKEHTVKKTIGKAAFAEYLLSGTRQRLYWSNRKNLKKKIGKKIIFFYWGRDPLTSLIWQLLPSD